MNLYDMPRPPVPLRTLTWDASFTVDSVFAGLSPPGIVRAGPNWPNDVRHPGAAGQAGQLVDNSGKAMTNYTFIVTAADGGLIDPALILVGPALDVDGTNYLVPTRFEDAAGHPESYRDAPGVPTHPIMRPLDLGSPPLLSFGGSFGVTSSYTAGVRFYCLNESGRDILVSVRFKQAT